MSLAQQQELESKYVMGTFARKPVEVVSGNGMMLTDDISLAASALLVWATAHPRS